MSENKRLEDPAETERLTGLKRDTAEFLNIKQVQAVLLLNKTAFNKEASHV